jgi:prepilin-type N-terminal cleavage/methylation domain-containing protein
VVTSFPKGTCANAKSGFTLLEALVALTVILAFAAALGPVLMQARRIMAGADDRVSAQLLVRALLSDPIDRAGLSSLAREGQTEGLAWRVTAEPSGIVAMFPPDPSARPAADPAQPAPPPPPRWVAYRVVATVTFGQGQVVSAETVRLGKLEPGRAEP